MRYNIHMSTSNWLKALGIGLGVAAGVGGGLYHRFVRAPLPNLNGRVDLIGLSAPAEVLWDNWGVPHVYAHTTEDMYFIQGYLHAQDRLWQMDLNRRIGSGRLSEIFGERALEADRFLRRVGLRRVAQEETKLLEGEVAQIQAAYCNGVNTFIRNNRERLPVEFTLLRYQPSPWTPVDSLQWAKLLGWSLSVNWDMELFRAQAIASFGQEKVEALEHPYPAGHPLTVPPGATDPLSGEAAASLWKEVGSILGGGMSNAWVVAGNRTESGKPLLVNDPHLHPQLPSVWYEMHLESPEVRVAGASVPGASGIIIGHNQHIAWGVTASLVDTQDLYLERFSDTERKQYQSEKGWQDTQTVQEPISVKGRYEPVLEEVAITRHGPVVSWSANDPLQGYALRSTLLEPSSIAKAGEALPKAKDWGEFRAAVADWSAPVLNMIYADAGGSIGCQLAGRIPRRKAGEGAVPQPGWTGDHEWQGYLTQDEAPHALNPDGGYVVTANNKPAQDSQESPLGGEWIDGYRAQRIQDILQGKERLSADDMQALQMDNESLPAREVARILRDADLHSPYACWARDQITQWDGSMDVESRPAALYQVFRQLLLQRVLSSHLGPGAERYLSATVHPLASTASQTFRGTALFLTLLEEVASGKRVLTPGETPTQLLESVLDEAVKDLGVRLGPKAAAWSWGRLHKVSFKHVLGRGPILSRLFNRGGMPLRGDGDTVHQAAFSLKDPYDATRWTPSYRLIADTSDWDKCRSVHAPGQSGQLGSSHYSDLMALWHRGEYHPMPFSRPAVEQVAASRQMFTPPAWATNAG